MPVAAAAQVAARTSRNAPVSDVSDVLDVFTANLSGVYVSRVGSTYSLLCGVGSARYWKCDLVQLTGLNGSHLVNQINTQTIVVPLLSVDHDELTVAYAGTWADPNSNASAYGGTYAYSTTADSTATWTTPAAATRVGVRIVKATNGGLAAVSIDGDSTAASLLPTAQSVVDSGLYANTILVANGGDLAPTDRVLDCFAYTTDYDALVCLADDLSAATHEVVITCLNYQRAADATAARTYLSGFAYGSTSTAPADGSTDWFVTANVMSNNSAWEYAVKAAVSGGSTATFLGNVHGYETQSALAVTVDGASTTVADGDLIAATNEVVITRTTALYHPEVGSSTTVANVVTTYRMTSEGLAVTPTITWTVAATVSASYVMLSVNGSDVASGTTFDRAGVDGYASNPITLPGTSDTFYGRSRGASAWVWNAGGTLGALMAIPGVYAATRNWANSEPGLMQVQDRDGDITKVYCTRVDPSDTAETAAAGDVWTWTARYVVAYFTDADTTLGGL